MGAAGEVADRVLALWVPDWPVVAAARAAHVPAHLPAAVVAGNRVLVCSAVARSAGVRRGLRRREAQARCPELVLLAADPGRDARAFEPVVVAVEELAPGVEVVRPGLVALPARGPSGYFGGELAAAERLVDHVAALTGVESQVGLADGLFAAVLAARRGIRVAVGGTPAFLAPLGVAELDREPDVDRAALVDLLCRLGLRSLGAFARLPAADVASRFGTDAVLAHRLARGLDPRPPARRSVPADLTVDLELDPPVDRVDAAAFAARGLAERLHRTLAGHGLSCTRLGIGARTEEGAELHRIWRCAEPLTPAGTVDRVRWQLDAWLGRGGLGALMAIRLVPEETVAAGALQLGLWGEAGAADARAARALVRVQAMLGPDGVATAVLVGGREPGERVRLVPWGDDRAVDGVPGPVVEQPKRPERALPSADEVWAAVGPSIDPSVAPASWPDDAVAAGGRRVVETAARVDVRRRPPAPSRTPTRIVLREPPAPWPGRIPAPSPATVPAAPVPAVLVDARGSPVGFVEPDELSAAPHRLAVDGGQAQAVEAWAGPWPVWQRWWAPGSECAARVQVVCADGTAFLLVARAGRWWVGGSYD